MTAPVTMFFILVRTKAAPFAGLHMLEFHHLHDLAVHLESLTVSEITCGNSCHNMFPPMYEEISSFPRNYNMRQTGLYILYENPAFGKWFCYIFRSFPEKVRSQAQRLLPASVRSRHLPSSSTSTSSMRTPKQPGQIDPWSAEMTMSTGKVCHFKVLALRGSPPSSPWPKVTAEVSTVSRPLG